MHTEPIESLGDLAEMSEEEGLIEETLKGNSESFGELILKYEPSVYRLAMLRVRNKADAEEIAQEAFLTAYQKLGQLSDRNRFGAWLRAITLRECAKWFRATKRDRETGRFEDGDGSDPEQAAPDLQVENENPFDLAGLIRDLPAGMRAAARLCLEEEIEPTKAAAMLGLKPGTLRKRFYDARAKLQRSIVQKAEQQAQLELLPRYFDQLCICRCEKAQAAQKGGEDRVEQLKNCGCGCMEKARQEAATKAKQAAAEPQKSGKEKQEKK